MGVSGEGILRPVFNMNVHLQLSLHINFKNYVCLHVSHPIKLCLFVFLSLSLSHTSCQLEDQQAAIENVILHKS